MNDTSAVGTRRAMADAARNILAIRDRYSDDYDRLLLIPEPPQNIDAYRVKLEWLIRELNRAAEWARTGSDPGAGFSGSARQAMHADEMRDEDTL